MNKLVYAAVAVTLTMTPVWAQPGPGPMHHGESGMMKKAGTCPQCHMMNKAGVCPMSHMMIKSMTETAMVATSDGGVVLLKGNRITKYDKNLAVVKSTEITIDLQGMQRGMRQMMEACPMKGMPETSDTETTE
jgi:hypothetical protein